MDFQPIAKSVVPKNIDNGQPPIKAKLSEAKPGKYIENPMPTSDIFKKYSPADVPTKPSVGEPTYPLP